MSQERGVHKGKIKMKLDEKIIGEVFAKIGYGIEADIIAKAMDIAKDLGKAVEDMGEKDEQGEVTITVKVHMASRNMKFFSWTRDMEWERKKKSKADKVVDSYDPDQPPLFPTETTVTITGVNKERIESIKKENELFQMAKTWYASTPENDPLKPRNVSGLQAHLSISRELAMKLFDRIIDEKGQPSETFTESCMDKATKKKGKK
jgi:hypothetical protein